MINPSREAYYRQAVTIAKDFDTVKEFESLEAAIQAEGSYIQAVVLMVKNILEKKETNIDKWELSMEEIDWAFREFEDLFNSELKKQGEQDALPVLDF